MNSEGTHKIQNIWISSNLGKLNMLMIYFDFVHKIRQFIIITIQKVESDTRIYKTKDREQGWQMLDTKILDNNNITKP